MLGSEMVMSNKILAATNAELSLLRKHESENSIYCYMYDLFINALLVFGVQICGSNAEVVGKASEFIVKECLQRENSSIQFFDFNCGCPVDLFCNKGMCAQLLCLILVIFYVFFI
jgi:tRNA-dihydrouridine synthase 3